MNYCKSECGAFYDEIGGKIYVGGGIGYTSNDTYTDAGYIREYYDIIKNKWYILPITRMAHRKRPCIWIDNDNRNLLYIASCFADYIECIDLRIDSNENSKMISIQTSLANKTLCKDIFCTKFVAHSRLFQ